ncbi:hypothetical protein J4231_01580 [Candidatus Woesearchaeota archaeon]|uniref:R15P Isomerase n=1 Tax=uncultured Candidatus Woesearchaeota archaeon TaxID=2014372 RepID=A0A447IU58_9ARCH|nr:hypothetical protein [Candidatus Woesearchaeota archaeon]VDS11058.1 R15P Isomerase [uncultured Candidatus Woesearchaeota archaeon]
MNFEKICKNIKELKIQGAENVARHGIKAFMMRHDRNSAKRLLSLRATEPLLKNAIKFSRKDPRGLGKVALRHFDEAQLKIAKIGSGLIRNNSVVYTHCHSSSVVDVLKEAKKTKKFIVCNTETRPRYQGRMTATELAKAGIKVRHFVDSGAGYALREADMMVIGADSITNKHVINKIGSGIFAKIARSYGVPVYVCADSWKYDDVETKIEERHGKEIWNTKINKIKVKNYAFEAIDMENITKIISEIGIYSPREFIKQVKVHYPWIQGEVMGGLDR